MTLVKVAHGRDNSDLLGVAACLLQRVAKFGNCVPGFHLTCQGIQSKQCSGAGNSPLLTASTYNRTACVMSLSDSARKFLTNLGRSGEMPNRSCSTST